MNAIRSNQNRRAWLVWSTNGRVKGAAGPEKIRGFGRSAEPRFGLRRGVCSVECIGLISSEVVNATQANVTRGDMSQARQKKARPRLNARVSA